MFISDLKKINFFGATINRTITSIVNHAIHTISIISNVLFVLYSGSVRISKSIVDKVINKVEITK